MCVIRLVRLDPKTKSETQEVYSWDTSRKVGKSLLQKSKAVRFEIWVPSDLKEDMIEKGWFPALRSDGTEISSPRGNVLLTYPERKPLPTFPY